MNIRVGILALQGDFEKHEAMLNRIGVPNLQVRKPDDLNGVDALIIPGGESTTIGRLMERYGLDEAIRACAHQGMPIYGTCAGMILLAKEIIDSSQPRLGLMDIAVRRNAFGRQRESFEVDLPFDGLPHLIRAVFIRAPIVERVGKHGLVLSEFEGKIVAVRQSNLLATAFHPELTDDESVHRYFLQMALSH